MNNDRNCHVKVEKICYNKIISSLAQIQPWTIEIYTFNITAHLTIVLSEYCIESNVVQVVQMEEYWQWIQKVLCLIPSLDKFLLKWKYYWSYGEKLLHYWAFNDGSTFSKKIGFTLQFEKTFLFIYLRTNTRTANK